MQKMLQKYKKIAKPNTKTNWTGTRNQSQTNNQKWFP